MILSLVVGIPFLAACRRVKVYESFIDGAKEGFDLIIKIFPYLLAMLVAVGMLRASGAFDLLDGLIGPTLERLGVPSAVVPLALIRPFSGSASNGILVDIIHHFGGDAFVSHLASTMMGSTETTFYVIAVYFGAAGITRTRYAIPAGLIADAVGIIASIVVCRLLLT
ncbi:MAG: spore maturation protein [Pseudomonadota bacterium]|nr:spore maturation protein [Pseudomonadota bacterium]